MKRMGPAILSIFCLQILLNCSSATISGYPITREWMLVSFKDYTKENLISHQAKINLTAPVQDGKIKGTAFLGCNKTIFTAAFKKSGTVTFSDIGSTQAACQEMEFEDEFFISFKKMHRYLIEGHFLILRDRQGNSMQFIASDWD